MAKIRNSEVGAYVFIKENLGVLNWDTRNPARHPDGEVYTQNEYRNHPELAGQLGLKTPENIVRITDTYFWVIEAKNTHAQFEQAIKEAIEYAEMINKSRTIKAVIVTGLAGNEIDGYLIQNRLLVEGDFLPITLNGKEMTGLVPKELAQQLIREWNPNIEDVQVDEKLFLSKAEKINQVLHKGAINKNYRARVMAALLLSLVEDPRPNIDAAPSILINDINGRVKRVLTQAGKPEFANYVTITLPPTEDNHIKFKNALVQTLMELNNLNIKSAMNSGTDVLGKFYEVFLKYGNGAKEIGIVLTPRHVTRFAAEVLDVKNTDFCLDPTCGTGGFLVAAYDYVSRNYSVKQAERFGKYNLFGIEQEPEVVALAIVNMIFRGDGKNNIVEGNCFQKFLKSKTENGVHTGEIVRETPPEEKLVVTKVLMNPPFSLKTSDEKEYKFIDQALKQIQDGGILFSVLPYSALVKQGGYVTWRKKLMVENTILSVITFPEDLFYPIGVHTVGIFIKKGVPHPGNQNVLWIRALNDGLLKSKGKRLPHKKAKNDYEMIKNTVKAFIQNPAMPVENIDRFQKTYPIDKNDDFLELVPENYLDQEPPTKANLKRGVEQVIRDTVAFVIKTGEEKIYGLN